MALDKDNKFILKRFGRYLLLDHLVDGGMATICRARFLGEQADKIVAIKMIQPQHSKDKAFEQMFMDEIKVCFSLIHPNIAQTYDYGIQDDQLYTAMEYVDGKNLKEFLDKLKEKRFVFPVEISVHIISQVCQGLNYAHTFTDQLTGKTSDVIHRDISPHNIMITYDGGIKIIDFGIAKAATNTDKTQAGIIKGKLSYLAPEYLEELELDARYDQFAVGITMWEMLCSRKLFSAKNDLSTLKLIQSCIVPAPSSINPNVPKELDRIVLKALSKDRNKRYQNMDGLNRALVKFLYSNYSEFNATDLAYFAKELFKDDIKKDREKLYAMGKIDLKPYIESFKKSHDIGASSDEGAAESAVGNAPGHTEHSNDSKVFDFGFKEGKEVKTATTRTRVGGKDDLGEQPIQENEPSRSTVSLSRSISPSGSTRTSITRERQHSKTGKYQNTNSYSKEESKTGNFLGIGKTFIAVAILILLGYFANRFYPEYKDKISNLLPFGENKRDQSKNDKFAQGRDTALKGKIIISNYVSLDHKVFINGKPVEVSVFGDVGSTYGTAIVVRIQQFGRKHYVTTVSLSEKSPVATLTVPEMPLAKYGYLVTSSSCVAGKLFFEIYGEKREEVLPISSKRGIAFPLGQTSQGESEPKLYNAFYQREEELLQRKVEIIVKRSDDSIDLCQLIIN